MKKQNYISFFILLFITIVAISTLIILIGRDKKAQREAAEEAARQKLTPAVLTTPSPTPTPEPTPAPEPVNELMLYPAYRLVENEKKYGYIDNTGSYVIQPTFDSATAFYDGVAVVSLAGKNLVIDTEGKIIYSNNTYLSEFRNGAAIFSDNSSGNNLYGYIDTKGNVIAEAKFKYAEFFRSDDTAYVLISDDTYALINKAGEILDTYIKAKDNSFDTVFNDGYLIFSEVEDTDTYYHIKYGVKSIKGNVLIKPEYSSIRYLGEGYFAVTRPGLASYEALYSAEAIITSSGSQVIDYKYYNISSIYNGLMSATDESTTFFIDLDGNKMASLPVFDGIGSLKLHGKVIEAFIDGQRLYCNDKKIIFWQEEQSFELAEGIIVRTKKFRPNRFALINYPYLEGIDDPDVEDAINLALEGIFVNPRREQADDHMTEINDYYSAALLGNLLIIERSGYDYAFGAAHGNPFRFFYYIDIRTGNFYHFKDLFIEGTDYSSKINEIISAVINKDLTSEDSMFYDGELGFTTIPEEPLFVLDKKAITIYFAPYEIAPYAAGFPEFLIPFEDIDVFINKHGDFWNSFH